MVKRNEKALLYTFHGAPNHGSFVKLTPDLAAEISKMAL